MTQNQSGKQLFEWVTFSQQLPDFNKIIPVMINGEWEMGRLSRFINHTPYFEYRLGDTEDNILIYQRDFEQIEWLDESPAQPSTGKQLPTDEEIGRLRYLLKSTYLYHAERYFGFHFPADRAKLMAEESWKQFKHQNNLDF